jgi:hypothetical protein
VDLHSSGGPLQRHGLPAVVDQVDLRRHTVSLLRLQLSSVMRSCEPLPHRRLETHRVGRLLASALPWRCFPVVRRQRQHPRPTVDPSVPPFAKTYFADAAPAPLSREDLRVFSWTCNGTFDKRENPNCHLLQKSSFTHLFVLAYTWIILASHRTPRSLKIGVRRYGFIPIKYTQTCTSTVLSDNQSLQKLNGSLVSKC